MSVATEGAGPAHPLGQEPMTQGERIYAVRRALGPSIREEMALEAFARRIADASGEDERAPSTILRWENDEGRGPTLKEGVAIARMAGQTAEWLSALDVVKARAKEHKEQPKPRAEAGYGSAGEREARVQPKGAKVADRKQGHGRGRKRNRSA